MAARPSSPTSLLWAHQLKREHGYLLKRMQDLEASNEQQAKRIKTAEAAAKSTSSADVIALAKQVKALSEKDTASRLSKLEHEWKRKNEDLEAGTEAITLQIAAMQKGSEERDEERRKTALTKEKSLLKRIGHVEAGLKQYEQSMAQLGRAVDEARLEQIQGQLEDLSKQVKNEGGQMNRLAESVTVLEAANEELRKSNEQLAAELERMAAARSEKDVLPSSSTIDAVDQDTRDVIETAPQKTTKKKKHSWSGGGPDRDIIKAGAEMFGDAITTNKKRPPPEQDDSDDEQPPPKKARAPPKPKQKYKPTPPHLRPATAKEAAKPKSHKWNGGGADRDIIREGRGWYEVACSPEADESACVAATSKTIAQPKKRINTPRWTVEEAMTQGRATRRGKQALESLDEVKDEAQPQEKAAAKVVARTKKTASKAAANTKLQDATAAGESGGGNPTAIFSSPRKRKPEPAVAAPPRRRIRQDDD